MADDKPQRSAPTLAQEVEADARRKLTARRHQDRGVWFGLGMMGLVGWSVVVLSVGAISLLYWLLRHGATSGVARLFYLVPPVTAVESWLLFGEKLDALAIAGMALIAAGVVLARPRT